MSLSSKGSLKGRRALICGASQGIGAASALALAERHCRLILSARREEELKKVAQRALEAGAESVEILPLDLGNFDIIKGVVIELLKKGPIEILLNNTAGPAPGPILKATISDFEITFARHLFAAQTLVQLLVPGMTEQGYGRIINIISTSVREPLPNLGVSNVVRGAMASWSKTLSAELPPSITINNVLPGYTKTERLDSLLKSAAAAKSLPVSEIEKQWVAQVPAGRFAESSETAALVAFLASAEAGYIRGQSIAVDGGRTKSL